jgi:ribosomal protein S18 acetylase RimI-like enzyme
MNVNYYLDRCPSTEQVINLYTAAGLPRPVQDAERINQMYTHSNLVVTAWDGDVLVGVARSFTDWVWACYLSDLAVHPDYQRQGIGDTLIKMTKEKLGDACMLLLLSVPTAMEYYPKVGFERQHSSFIINRKY